MRFWASLLVALVLLLGGCTDEGGSNGSDDDSTPGDGDGTGDGGNGTGTGEEPVYAPKYHNGTVTAPLDCSLAANDQAPRSPETISLDAEDANRTYTLTEVLDGDPDVPILCISLDGGSTYSTDLTGTVPADATEIRIAADRAPNGVDYSLKLE